MNKRIHLASALLLTSSLLFAQKKEKEIKYEKIFYKDTKLETADYTLIISNAVSTDAETKFKLKIINKTNAYLIYKPEESKFMINNTPGNVIEKQMLIDPFQSESKVINLKGAGYNRIKTYSFMAAGIYKVIPGAESIAGEDFKLPPAKNSITAGPFVITQEKLSKATDKTTVKFSCLYTGEKMGLVAPQKANMRMPDGKDYATVKKEKPFILAKGQTDTFVLEWDRIPGGKATDMQLVDMIIRWNDMLNEASPEKTNAETLTLEIDEVKSK
jgi:hypothetical protein